MLSSTKTGGRVMDRNMYEAITKDSPDCREVTYDVPDLTDEQCFLMLQTIKERAEKHTYISSIALLVIGIVGFASVIFVSL
jgi:hypothetical protein